MQGTAHHVYLLLSCRRSRPTKVSERRVEVAELGGAHATKGWAAFGRVGHLLRCSQSLWLRLSS